MPSIPTLRFGHIELPTAPLGPPNPLPPVGATLASPYQLNMDGVADTVRRNSTYGNLRNVYPHLTQDNYTRHREPHSHRTAVLDNGLLRAEFLLGAGGRLRALHDLATDTELLYANPVVQPANLALRNAWLAGGVEWNLGTRGHSVTTCDPLFAAEATGPNGEPALRMWEFERMRGQLFRIDAWLPAGAARLHVRISVKNLNSTESPVYWWSNMAVRETPGLRVLAPAEGAFATTYDGRLSVVPAGDWTYPERSNRSGDWFFNIPPEVEQPWEAAVRADGTGLLHSSTRRLRGRKLFVWGQHPGGRRWAEWLTEPGNDAYTEIQGGLAQTQFEHLPMPAGAEWTWIETYQPLAADPAAVHDPDWAAATAAVAEHLPSAELPLGHPAFSAPPVRLEQHGSGWGALERLRRAEASEHTGPEESADKSPDGLDDPAVPFPAESLSPDQEPWLTLLRTGALPEDTSAGHQPPVSYVSGADWAARLQAAPQTWATTYHLAVQAHAAGELTQAQQHYQASLEIRRTAWALRGAALLAVESGEPAEAADQLASAAWFTTEVWQLAAEAAALLLAAGRAEQWLRLVDTLPKATAGHPRIQLYTARAAVEAGQPERCRALLDAGIEVADYQEGELSLPELWAAVYPDRPLPERYDFRMRVEERSEAPSEQE